MESLHPFRFRPGRKRCRCASATSGARQINGLTRRHRRRPGVQLIGLAVLGAFVFSGCDPSHLFDDFRVKVRLRDDSTAAVAADVFDEGMSGSSVAPDPGALSVVIAEALAVGELASEPRVYENEFGFQAVGVEVRPRAEQPVRVELATIAEELASQGVDPQRSRLRVRVQRERQWGRQRAVGRDRDAVVVWDLGRIAR